MSELTSFRSIIDLWPSRDELAAEVGHPSNSVSKWRQRDRIPSEWWNAVLALPRAREAGLTAETLAIISERRDRFEVA